MEYKVGQLVKGLSDDYGITNKNMTLGKITKVTNEYIEIQILEYLGDVYYKNRILTTFHPEGKFEVISEPITASSDITSSVLTTTTWKDLAKELEEAETRVLELKQKLKELL